MYWRAHTYAEVTKCLHLEEVLNLLIHCMKSGVVAQRVVLDLRSTGRGFKSSLGQKLRNNLG